MADYSAFGLRIAVGHPQKCSEEIERRSELQPCEKVAVALRIDPHESEPYPVCRKHVRANMVPLEDIVRFLLEREEAQRMIASGLVRMASRLPNSEAATDA